ncbi:hypothetical protein CVT24_000998 [Panaeolus cyanescens]|uniref:DUF6533 domain-containing protein n=1 Tax=Panaeolus cyanescens TaxID=181874 RepID=A0A409YCK4_9AGAR|nr:hypothetical protein CVT24_000998 [Panaeolus cyanescens]
MSGPNGPYPNFVLAMATAAIYEHVTTADQEHEFIWRRPNFNLVQCLFIVTRYLGNATLIHAAIVAVTFNDQSAQVCIRNMQIQGWLTCFVLWAMQGIMILRLAVMWRYNRMIIYVLSSAFAVEVVALSFIQGFASRTGTSTNKLRVHRATCEPNYPADWYFLMWLPILVFEGVMLITVIKRAMLMCPIRNPAVLKALRGEKPSLMQVMMRDSIMFPMVALFICVVNFLGWLVLPIWFARVAVTFSAFTARMLGSRLVLNLRDVYYRPFEDEYMHTVLQPITFETDSSHGTLSPSPRKSVFSFHATYP